jgi:hypothetical protein
MGTIDTSGRPAISAVRQDFLTVSHDFERISKVPLLLMTIDREAAGNLT